MADKPIIFSGPMVRALLEGRKTQTRRVLKEQPQGIRSAQATGARTWDLEPKSNRCAVDWTPPHYAPGDRLWVQEAFNAFQFSQDGDESWPVEIPTLEECKEVEELAYRYGAPQIVYSESDRARKWFTDQIWRPSIHMPRWASRLTLIVTDVRVQRLQEISEADAVAEGAKKDIEPMVMNVPSLGISHRNGFAVLWNTLHGPDAWDVNPWVCALTFEVHRRNIDDMPSPATL